jgi:NAD(P)-dependent dehydrogenase (short-subunit alcohol dehydrogenase family)
MLQRAEEGHIVNTSSINGFWASIGPDIPQTAYAAAKFAVKGFSEALITDLRLNAPHIKCSVVMPGHIGTSIPLNSRKIQTGADSDAMNSAQLGWARARLASSGRDASNVSDEELRAMVAARERRFVEDAPTSASEAATIILDGVKADRWRIGRRGDRRAGPPLTRAGLRDRFLRKLSPRGRLAPARIARVSQHGRLKRLTPRQHVLCSQPGG